MIKLLTEEFPLNQSVLIDHNRGNGCLQRKGVTVRTNLGKCRNGDMHGRTHMQNNIHHTVALVHGLERMAQLHIEWEVCSQRLRTHRNGVLTMFLISVTFTNGVAKGEFEGRVHRNQESVRCTDTILIIIGEGRGNDQRVRSRCGATINRLERGNVTHATHRTQAEICTGVRPSVRCRTITGAIRGKKNLFRIRAITKYLVCDRVHLSSRINGHGEIHVFITSARNAIECKGRDNRESGRQRGIGRVRQHQRVDVASAGHATRDTIDRITRPRIGHYASRQVRGKAYCVNRGVAADGLVNQSIHLRFGIHRDGKQDRLTLTVNTIVVESRYYRYSVHHRRISSIESRKRCNITCSCQRSHTDRSRIRAV